MRRSLRTTTIRQTMVTTVMPYAVRRLVVLLAVLAAYSTHWSPTYADGTTTAAPSSSSSTTTADDQDFHNAESSFKSALAIINAAASQPRAIRRAMEVLHDLSLGTGRVSADSLAELALLHLVGVHGTHDFPKAAAYAQRSAALGSPKGRHVHAFILLHGGIGGVARNVTEAWRQEDLAAQQNYHPALLAVGFRDLLAGRCEGALRQYRAAALAAASIVDSSFYGDYPSLRPLTMDQDGLGDGAADKVTEGGNEEGFPWTRLCADSHRVPHHAHLSSHHQAARDVETLSYWHFLSDRKDAKAYYELGRIYQLGLLGLRPDVDKAAEQYEKAALQVPFTRPLSSSYLAAI